MGVYLGGIEDEEAVGLKRKNGPGNSPRAAFMLIVEALSPPRRG